jgi:hypothetical protein
LVGVADAVAVRVGLGDDVGYCSTLTAPGQEEFTCQ